MTGDGSGSPRVDRLDGYEIIHPPNTLKLKVGGELRAHGERSVARVNAALQALSSNYESWLEQELVGLEAGRAVMRDHGLTAESTCALTTRALDIKGLGATYGYPLVSRIASSLFKLLDEADPTVVPVLLVDAHIDGMRALIRGKIREASHEVGLDLVQQLEARVRDYASQSAAAARRAADPA
jgi:hypothetical protein